ncbi:hypothetical protein CCP3SC1AL1_1000005 [Gammaproteobacteria bacterium]
MVLDTHRARQVVFFSSEYVRKTHILQGGEDVKYRVALRDRKW